MILYRWLLALKQPSNRLWVTPALWAIGVVCFIFATRLVGVWIPHDTLPEIELDTLEGLLDVISSSMLAVTTFSLSIMVSAFASASGGATPRATELVMGDDNTRTAIASFLSSFIYAIIARTALGMDFYGQNELFILFVSTVAVFIYLIATLIRWVYTLSHLGRMDNTIQKILSATKTSVAHYFSDPQLGAAWRGACSSRAKLVRSGYSGYLTHINMASLQDKAEEADLHIHILVRPGELVMEDTPLMMVEGHGDTDTLNQCFVFGTTRSYAQDPNWGFVVLSEVAQRALSPAVNDPGTAISVMTGMMEVLTAEQPEQDEESSKKYNRLSIKPEACEKWIMESFDPIARDGANTIEVGLVMQKVLAGIWRNTDNIAISQAAAEMASIALQRSVQEMTFAHDAERLKAKHYALFGSDYNNKDS
ncbi:DUF2254 domain-containing protein [Neisseria montereyensis]|uniref:DUF2254 domain-containing protein n=1 Tax=Neisseria montereyensis TaxID=2973938 RepID=A0ABT2FEJ9_9NEIS|nr:DUF2254 family protein [Neisseria montereyensis]MCS4534639.1 DUF2254 domain-containing protein [Neisseria montereyensis]